MQLIEKISNVKETAADSESMVKVGCTEIRKLDTAKKNITFSITSLKRLIMLSKLSFATKFHQSRVLSSSHMPAWIKDTRKLPI